MRAKVTNTSVVINPIRNIPDIIKAIKDEKSKVSNSKIKKTHLDEKRYFIVEGEVEYYL